MSTERQISIERATVARITVLMIAFYALLFAAGFLMAMNPPATKLRARRGAPVRAASGPPAALAVIDWRVPLRHWLEPRPEPVIVPQPPTIASVIHDTAIRHSLSPALVSAMIRVESDFDPREVSPKGACGLMQVMPETAARFGVRRSELFDPARNIAVGTTYMAWLLDRYRGDLDLALAAYNAGEGAVDAHGGIPPYRETRQYVRRVRAALQKEEIVLDAALR